MEGCAATPQPLMAGNLAQRKIVGRRSVIFEHQRRGTDVPACEYCAYVNGSVEVPARADCAERTTDQWQKFCVSPRLQRQPAGGTRSAFGSVQTHVLVRLKGEILRRDVERR